MMVSKFESRAVVVFLVVFGAHVSTLFHSQIENSCVLAKWCCRVPPNYVNYQA
jgi:hypothetical protein